MLRLILFDVDGTLLSTDGKAGRAIAVALRETFGTAGPIEGYSFAGKTDPQIIFELTAQAGFPRSEVAPLLPKVFDAYCGHLAAALTPANTRVLPGVREVLDALAARGDAAVGLLTGNIRRGAEIKLAAAGLSGRFAIGAFGSDEEDRNRLVPVARARARERWGEEFPGARTVVVGDAQADIRCARAGGARAVAVASSKTPKGELAALAPDALLDSLAAPEALTALVATDP
ncbi:MAG: haloacid dehalogenase-like hydrolase [Thermoanaerobaculaceae bacterium]|nr:haloacid dehalogenase-like hydrolase [Thermoanaerobaculaceae bacterium]